MSRYGRILPEADYYVHVMSRVVNRDFVLGDREKAYFVLHWCYAERLVPMMLDR